MAVLGVYFTRFEQVTSASSDARLNDITAIMTIVGGTPPYSASWSGTGLTITNQTGPEVYMELERNGALDRTVTIGDSTGLNSGSIVIPTLQKLNESLDYQPYIFAPIANGPATATLTQDLSNTSTYNYYATRQIRVVDIETSFGLSEWETVPVGGSFDFLGLPLRSVNIEVIDEYNSFWSTYRAIEIPLPADEITIIQDISPISFINNPQNIVVSGKANYIDTFKLEYDGITVETYPDRLSGYGVFTINELVPQFNQEYSTASERSLFLAPKFNSIINSADQIASGKYTVQDAFGSIESDTKYFISGATNYGETFNINDYICNPFSTNGQGDTNPNIGVPDQQKFLTAWTGNFLLRTDDYATIKFLNGNFEIGYNTVGDLNINNTAVAFVRYSKDEEPHEWIDGDPLFQSPSKCNYILFANGGMDPFLNEKQTVPYGPQNFQDALDAGKLVTFSGGTRTENFLLDANTDYYEVFLIKNDTIATKGSESIFIDLNKSEQCGKYEPTRIFWEDSFGCYNSFTFNGSNVKSYEIDRSTSASNINSLNRNTGAYGYDIGDRGRKTNSMQRVENHVATSGWIDGEMSTNLMDMYASADAYVIINGESYPILIDIDEVEEKNIENNRLFNHRIAYTMAYDINTNV